MKKVKPPANPSAGAPSRAQLLNAIARIEAANNDQLVRLTEVSVKHSEENKKLLDGIQKGLEMIYEKQDRSRAGFDDNHQELIDVLRRVMVLVASGILIIAATLILLAV